MAKMYRFHIWNEFDPNDSFEVEAPTVSAAAWEALDRLGWVVGERIEPAETVQSTDTDSDEELFV